MPMVLPTMLTSIARRGLLIGLVVLALVGYGVVVAVAGRTGRDATAFEHEMRSSLPVGSSRQHVDERFRAVGLGRRFIAAEHTLVAITPTVRRGLFQTESVEIRAHFDDAERLTELEFRALRSS